MRGLVHFRLVDQEEVPVPPGEREEIRARQEIDESLRLLEEDLGVAARCAERLLVGRPRPEPDLLVESADPLVRDSGRARERTHVDLGAGKIRSEREDLAPRTRASFFARDFHREPIPDAGLPARSRLRQDQQPVVVDAAVVGRVERDELDGVRRSGEGQDRPARRREALRSFGCFDREPGRRGEQSQPARRDRIARPRHHPVGRPLGRRAVRARVEHHPDALTLSSGGLPERLGADRRVESRNRPRKRAREVAHQVGHDPRDLGQRSGDVRDVRDRGQGRGRRDRSHGVKTSRGEPSERAGGKFPRIHEKFLQADARDPVEGNENGPARRRRLRTGAAWNRRGRAVER